MMEYKGYVAEVEYDETVGLLHGRVLNTRDMISFEADSAKEVRGAFENAVDDYLAEPSPWRRLVKRRASISGRPRCSREPRRSRPSASRRGAPPTRTAPPGGCWSSALYPYIHAAVHRAHDRGAEAVVAGNVRNQVEVLRAASPVLVAGIRGGTLDVVGAVFDFRTGLVGPVPAPAAAH